MRIFISRELMPDDSLARTLELSGHVARGWPLVLFEPVPFSKIPDADWVFFYSKNAVRFFFKNLDNQHVTPPNVRWAAMGDGTAAALEKKLHRLPDFIGDGDLIGTATRFLGEARGQKVIFVKSKNSRENIARLLASSVIAIDLVVYENRPLEKISPLDDDVLVFTSPLNAEAYFSKNKLRSTQRLVAIGRPTADALENLGFSNFAVANEPTEAGLVRAILG